LIAGGFTVSAEDADGDAVAGGVTVNVNVLDDIPVAYSPDDQVIVNVSGGVITGDLNIAGKEGADGASDVTITSFTYGGTTYTAGSTSKTTSITSGGKAVTLSGFGTDTLTGTSEDGNVFTVSVDEATGLYTMNLVKPLDDGSGITEISLGELASGNPNFEVASAVTASGTTLPFKLLFSGNDNNTVGSVNISQGATTGGDSTGVANNSFNSGQILGIDFVDSSASDNKNGSNYTYNYTKHETLQSFKFIVTQITGGTSTISLSVRAFDSTASDPSTATNTQADHWSSLWNTATKTQDVINSISVTDYSTGTIHVLDTSISTSQYGYTLTSDGLGGFQIDGLGVGDGVTVSTSSGFNRLEIEHEVGAFDIGDYGVQQLNAGSEMLFNVGTSLIDGDGDVAAGSFDVKIQPESNNSSLLGGDGDDIIFGGSGNDTLTGGIGDDRFVIEGQDNIMDFNANSTAESDILDLSGVIDIGADETLDQYLQLGHDSGKLKVSITDGNGNLTGDSVTFDNINADDVADVNALKALIDIKVDGNDY